MRISRLLVATVASLALVTAACGSGSSGSSSAIRSVAVEMRDNAFSPNQVTVHAGEKVRFVFHNAGHLAHEALLGDMAAQDSHETEMMSGGTGGTQMGMDHGASTAITVEPGKSATLTHTFQAGDKLLIGCHETGHYAAGMKLMIDVA